jgi:hypothetical protein
MPEPRSTPNGNKILGLPVTTVTYLVNSVGVPILLLAFGCYLMWMYIPPVVDSHLELLNTTRETLKAMEETLRADTEATKEVVEVQREHRVFMKDIRDDHRLHKTCLERMHADVREVLDRVQVKLKNGNGP